MSLPRAERALAHLFMLHAVILQATAKHTFANRRIATLFWDSATAGGDCRTEMQQDLLAPPLAPVRSWITRRTLAFSVNYAQ